MKDLADKVALRTGLTKDECDGMIKVIVHEIIQDLRYRDTVEVKGLGKISRIVLGQSSRKLSLILTVEAFNRLTAPYKEEGSDEISFE